MNRRLPQLIATLLALLAAAWLRAGTESSMWIFEGLITEADPALAPDLQSGWVLAGSFVLTPLEMQEEPVATAGRAGRLAGGISATELTVDLYHQVLFEAQQVPGLAGFDFTDNDPDKDGRDLLGWFFPVSGRLGDTGWSARWLQVWLADAEGRMIRSVPPAISPYGLDWKHGWFRLTLQDEAGESAFVDGRMDIFAPEGSLEPVDEAAGWKDVASHLGGVLLERDSMIASLRDELQQARERLDGLRRMVDLLVQERGHLQQENALLQEKAGQADPQVEARIADLTAGKSLLEQQVADLEDRNHALAESLAASEQQRLRMLEQLARLEQSVQEQQAASPPPRSTSVPVLRDDVPVGTMTIIEKPMIIERPVVIGNPSASTQPAAIGLPPAAPAEPAGLPGAPQPRPRGPRKFR